MAAFAQPVPVSFFPDTIDFERRVPGYTFSQGSISYSNSGTVPLTITAINTSPGFSVSGCPVGTVIGASSTCFLTASATAASPGYVEGTVQIVTSPPSTNSLLTLQIRGATAAEGTLVQNTNDTGTGSLNAALRFIQDNCVAGPHAVTFTIPGTDTKHISMGEVALPKVTCDGTVIDGYTQPGSVANSATDATTNAVIKISLEGFGTTHRLEIQANNVTVRGLVVDGVSGSDGAIYIDGDNNVVAGNFIGTNAAGTGGGENEVGVLIYGGAGNRIGGEFPEDRNLITGNTGSGIIFDCCRDTARTVIRNNLIGGSAAGDNSIGNGGVGIDLQEPGATVTDNLIRFNGSHGIHVKGGDNQLSQNRIAGNGGRAICNLYVNPVTFEPSCAPLQDDVTAPYDQDGGAGLNNSGNHLQNHPVLSSVIHAEGSTKVAGVLRTNGANAQYRIELFWNSLPGVSQAEEFADAFVVTTDATGEATFLQIFGEYRNHITATATRVAAPYDTSELSPSVSKASPNRLLTVLKSGSGTGLVISDPAGIDCGLTCSTSIVGGNSVILSADASGGSVFTGWSGEGCNGTGQCILTMDADKTVTADFAAAAHTLTVQKTGSGSGLVVSIPAGISCGSTCSADFAAGSSVTLSADAFGNSAFTGWSGGGCTGTGACTVTMDSAKTVSAAFASTTTTLTVAKAGGGNGLVVSNPAGISCGSTCTGDFLLGSQVTLTHDVGANSAFAGWFGACSGTGPCVVTMNSPSVVTATFESTLKLLTVQSTGAGTGLVVSIPSGINCTGTCSAQFPQSTVVTLVHDAVAGSAFAGWSGACTGTGACTVTMDAAKTVLASFVPATAVLTVQNAGTGTGFVASNPGGIACGATCSAAFALGATVTLLPDPSGGSTFSGWSGACTGSGACSVTMDAAKTVTATFTAPVPTQAFAYIPNQNSGNVSVIDTLTNAIVNTIFTGTNPNGIAVNASGTRAYVGNGGSNTVSAIDTATGNVLANIPVGSPFGVALNPAGTRVYVANTITGAMVVINTATNTVVTSLADAALRGLVVNPAGTRVYASNFDSVKVIDAVSNTILATVPISAAAPNTPTPQGMAVHPAGTEVYVANQTNNTVEVIGTASNTVIATIAVGSSPVGVGFNPAGTRAYVTNSSGNTVSVIDTGTRGVIATIPVGTRPQGVSVTPDGLRAYVANRNSHNVSVIDTATNTVIATVAAGTNPTAYGHFTGPAPVAAQYTLTVSQSGTGSGVISSSPAGINCGTSCSASFLTSATVTLTATPDAGSAFAGWVGGGCTGTDVCVVTMDAAQSITATFDFSGKVRLTVVNNSSSATRVQSSPAGVNCPNVCTLDFDPGTPVTLNALVSGGFQFLRWEGACSGSDPVCVVTMDVAKTVTAFFGTPAPAISITPAGPLAFTAFSGVAAAPQVVTLTSTGNTVANAVTIGFKNTFLNGLFAYTGDCPAVLPVGASCTVSITLAPPAGTSGLSFLGPLVVSSSNGGDIGQVQVDARVNAGTATASPATAAFAALAGAASAPQNITFTAVNAVAANIAVLVSDPPAFQLTTNGCSGQTLAPGQSCTVAIAYAPPAGSASGTDARSASFVVDSTFQGVTSRLSIGSAALTGTRTAAASVTVTRAGSGTGQVASGETIPVVQCGTACAALFAIGSSVTLTATADAGSVFGGWSGACTGSGACVVAVDAAKAVTASFTAIDTVNPTAVLSASPPTVAVGSPVQLSGAGSFDGGTGQVKQYLFSAISTPAGSTGFPGPVITNSPTVTFTPDRAGTWLMRLVVTDDAGNQSAPTQLSLVVQPLPTAIINAPTTGKVGVSLTLNAGASTPAGSVVQYRWSLGQRPAGSVVPSLPLVSASPLLTFAPDRLGRYDIQLVVVDSSGNHSAPVQATIIVADTDNPNAILDATPAAPVVGSAVTLSGARSTDAGGGSITSYRFTAVARPAGATAFAAPVISNSPAIAFTPDKAGVWRIALVVSDDAGNQSSATELLLTVTVPPFELDGVVSRKDHGSAGTFDLPLKVGVPVSGAVSVEPRMPQAGHRVVFVFRSPVTSFTSVAATGETGAPIGSASATIAGDEVIVSLATIPNASRVNIALKGVNGELDVEVALAFLLGDVNGSRQVDGVDVTAIKSRAGQKASAATFRFDIVATGAINATDVLVAKARQGSKLP